MDLDWIRAFSRRLLRFLELVLLALTSGFRGSWLSIHGENLPLIQKVLNHSSLAVTQVYARLDVTPIRRALEEQSVRMLGSLLPAPATPPPDRDVPERDTPEWPG